MPKMMTVVTELVDPSGVPTPHLRIDFRDGTAWSYLRGTLLHFAAMLQLHVPEDRRWGALAVPPPGEGLRGYVYYTNVAATAADLAVAMQILDRFVGVLEGRR